MIKYLFQAGIIITISFIGEILSRVIPFPIPASVYGMTILFLLLLFKVIKLSWVEGAGNFFLTLMPFFFISANVSIMNSFEILGESILGILIISIVSTLMVMIVTALVAQTMTRLQNKLQSRRKEK